MSTHAAIFLVAALCTTVLALLFSFLLPAKRSASQRNPADDDAFLHQESLPSTPGHGLTPREVDEIFANASEAARNAARKAQAPVNPHPPQSLAHDLWKLQYRAAYREWADTQTAGWAK